MSNMWFFNLMDTIFPYIFITIFIMVFGGIAFSLVQTFSPKARAKMMGKQIDAVNYLMKDKASVLGETEKILVKTQADVISDSKDDLSEMMDDLSDISTPAIKKTMSAIKEGLADNLPKVHCKHCGKLIDADSKFCRHCGERQ